MAPSAVAAFAAIIVSILKLIGVEVGSEELTDAIHVFVVIISGIIIYLRQIKTKRATWTMTRPQ